MLSRQELENVSGNLNTSQILLDHDEGVQPDGLHTPREIAKEVKVYFPNKLHLYNDQLVISNLVKVT